MNTRAMTMTTTLALGIMLTTASESFGQHRTSTLTTRRGGTVTTTVDGDRSDGSVGAQRVVTGTDGRSAAASRSTTVQDGTIVHQGSETGFNGRTASRQDVYAPGSSSHSRTGRLGQSRSWARRW